MGHGHQGKLCFYLVQAAQMLVGIGPQSATVAEVVLQFYILMGYQELQHLFKQQFYFRFGFEIIDGVW